MGPPGTSAYHIPLPVTDYVPPRDGHNHPEVSLAFLKSLCVVHSKQHVWEAVRLTPELACALPTASSANHWRAFRGFSVGMVSVLNIREDSPEVLTVGQGHGTLYRDNM